VAQSSTWVLYALGTFLMFGLTNFLLKYASVKGMPSLEGTAVLLLGTGKLEFELHPHLKEHIDQMDEPLDILVFVTPTCPYCPYAVKAAHRIAYLNPNVRGIMVEAIEYDRMADKYAVSAVPKNVVVDRETGETLIEWEGCPPVMEQAVDMFVHYAAHALLHKKGVPHEH